MTKTESTGVLDQRRNKDKEPQDFRAEVPNIMGRGMQETCVGRWAEKENPERINSLCKGLKCEKFHPGVEGTRRGTQMVGMAGLGMLS